MKFIHLILLLPLTLLCAQTEEVCEGVYESVLHDSSSGINQQGLSRIEAEKKGYILTLQQDPEKITIIHNGKRKIYVKEKSTKYKYVKDKTEYLLKPDNKEHDLYIYTKDLLVKYDCTSGKEEPYEEEKKVEEKYTTFSKFIKRGQVFLFEKEGITVELSDLEEKKEKERSVTITLVKDKGYQLYLWCYKDKEDYLDGLIGEEGDFEYYVCSDTGGSVQIKIDARGVYLQPAYMTLQKEVMINGEVDVDFLQLGGWMKFVKGKLLGDANTVVCDEKKMCNAEYTTCIVENSKILEKELEHAYRTLLEKQSDKVFKKKIENAQKVWKKYREAQLQMAFPHAGEHKYFWTGFSACYYSYKNELTLKRIKELEGWVRWLDESGCKSYNTTR